MVIRVKSFLEYVNYLLESNTESGSKNYIVIMIQTEEREPKLSSNFLIGCCGMLNIAMWENDSKILDKNRYQKIAKEVLTFIYPHLLSADELIICCSNSYSKALSLGVAITWLFDNTYLDIKNYQEMDTSIFDELKEQFEKLKEMNKVPTQKIKVCIEK